MRYKKITEIMQSFSQKLILGSTQYSDSERYGALKFYELIYYAQISHWLVPISGVIV